MKALEFHLSKVCVHGHACVYVHVCHSAHVTKDSFSEVVFPPGFRQGLSVFTDLGTLGLPALKLPGDLPISTSHPL